MEYPKHFFVDKIIHFIFCFDAKDSYIFLILQKTIIY